MPPLVLAKTRESAAASLAVKLMEAPERISISLPAVPVPVEISMPPAADNNWIESAAPSPAASRMMAPALNVRSTRLLLSKISPASK